MGKFTPVSRAGEPLEKPHMNREFYLDLAATCLVPVGMANGPFSLLTKLVADPITAIALAGMGVSPGDDPEVLSIHRCLALAELTVSRSLAAQMEAGAAASTICEPAANQVCLSPRQIGAGADILERFALEPNLRLRGQLAASGVDLIFHDCGELTASMVEQFGARLVSDNVMLFGNLPAKSFCSDSEWGPCRECTHQQEEPWSRRGG